MGGAIERTCAVMAAFTPHFPENALGPVPNKRFRLVQWNSQKLSAIPANNSSTHKAGVKAGEKVPLSVPGSGAISWSASSTKKGNTRFAGGVCLVGVLGGVIGLWSGRHRDKKDGR